MIILSVDPGYERLGISVIEFSKTGDEKLLYSNCFKTKNTLPFPERLRNIGEEIEKLIKEYSPEFFASESLFFTTNQKTALYVAGARGVLLYIARKNDLSLYEYTPLQIKIAVTGYGKSDKTHVKDMVTKLIKIEKDILYDDEYDAIAVGLTCIASENLTKNE